MALRLLLPSFGAYTGGLDVGDAAIASLFAGRFHAFMLGQERVYAIAAPDRRADACRLGRTMEQDRRHPAQHALAITTAARP